VTYEYNYFNIDRFKIASPDKLPPGPATIRVEFKYDGGGAGKGGTATIFVNDKQVAQGHVDKTISGRFSADETFDIGLDTGSPVSNDYEAPFKFGGTVETVKVDLGSAGERRPTGQPNENSQLKSTQPQDRLEASTLLNDGVPMTESEKASYQSLMERWALHD
jgi:hypothetical protein